MKKIYKQLDRLGYPAHLLGTGYLADAVRIAMDNRGALMCKDVYPAIAEARNISMNAVERNIRSATQVAIKSPVWEREWRELGGVCARPTNSEAIHRVARSLVDED